MQGESRSYERNGREHGTVTGYKDKHIERLADNFAGGLLVPRALIEPLWTARRPESVNLQDWIAATAIRFRVSGEALKWRLVNLGLISQVDLQDVADGALVAPPTQAPPPFSRAFLERAGRAIERADVSVMRLVKLLGATGTGGLREMIAAHGLPIPSGIPSARGGGGHVMSQARPVVYVDTLCHSCGAPRRMLEWTGRTL